MTFVKGRRLWCGDCFTDVRFPKSHPGRAVRMGLSEREFFIDNLLVRIHFIIEMIWWTGLAPWEF